MRWNSVPLCDKPLNKKSSTHRYRRLSKTQSWSEYDHSSQRGMFLSICSAFAQYTYSLSLIHCGLLSFQLIKLPPPALLFSAFTYITHEKVKVLKKITFFVTIPKRTLLIVPQKTAPTKGAAFRYFIHLELYCLPWYFHGDNVCFYKKICMCKSSLPYAFPTLWQTFIFAITYFFTSSRPAALYFFGSIVSGFSPNTAFTPFVNAILRSVA